MLFDKEVHIVVWYVFYGFSNVQRNNTYAECMLRKKLELLYRWVLADHQFFNIYFLCFVKIYFTGLEFYVETINNVNVKIIFVEIINYRKVKIEVEVVSLLTVRSLYVNLLCRYGWIVS